MFVSFLVFCIDVLLVYLLRSRPSINLNGTKNDLVYENITVKCDVLMTREDNLYVN